MKFFGLLSLAVVLGVGAWVVSRPSTPVAPDETGTATATDYSYGDAIDAAREAADSLSGDTVEIYDGVQVAASTRQVDLSGRGLSGSLKAEIRHLNQVEVLDLSDNNFTDLPAEVGQLSKLRTLNLSNNPLTGLPYELGNLSKLEVLDLRGTNYAAADLQIIAESLPATVQILVD